MLVVLSVIPVSGIRLHDGIRMRHSAAMIITSAVLFFIFFISLIIFMGGSFLFGSEQVGCAYDVDASFRRQYKMFLNMVLCCWLLTFYSISCIIGYPRFAFFYIVPFGKSSVKNYFRKAVTVNKCIAPDFFETAGQFYFCQIATT